MTVLTVDERSVLNSTRALVAPYTIAYKSAGQSAQRYGLSQRLVLQVTSIPFRLRDEYLSPSVHSIWAYYRLSHVRGERGTCRLSAHQQKFAFTDRKRKAGQRPAFR
jgi:hypothetical protein